MTFLPAVVAPLVVLSTVLRVGEIPISSGKLQLHMTPVSSVFLVLTSILYI